MVNIIHDHENEIMKLVGHDGHTSKTNITFLTTKVNMSCAMTKEKHVY